MLPNASHLQSGVSPKYTQALLAWGLLFMRVSVSLLLLQVHGLPKLMHWSVEVQRIEDPFGLGGTLTLGLAVFAEVICPVLLILGVWARLACLPVLAVLAVAVLFVHPEWSLEQGQFAWLLMILFAGLAITGPGPLVIGKALHKR
ncbi:DoxX family protein [Pseudomonas sp. 20GA0068]|uniref:DoxX family protein n=2 Tax=Pseudomonas TaxID=286 RepID=A0ABS4CC08_9PSED|nr:DoxX family protein [Pseudomonas alliivorans]MBP0947894.1 DoxX family protein [Pseudomonas alliivorans]MBP0953006.1 DoxX family protein [Pseudomonas alliivorans]